MRKVILLCFYLLSASLQAATSTEPPKPTNEITIQTPIVPHEEPSKTQAPSYEHAFIKMLLTLGGLLFLVFATLWALRKLSHGRIGNFGAQKRIKLLEKRPLSPKTMLYLVEIDGKQVFVSESQLEVRSLLNLSEMEL
jgi:flagellar protein FliO/FliZ